MTITKSQGLIRTPGLHGPLSRFSGFALVAAVVGVETLAVVLLQHRGQGLAVDVLYLIGVLVVSAVCELGLAVATSLGSAIALLYTYAGQYELDAAVVAGLFLVVAVPTNFVADFARRVVRHAGQRRRKAEQKAAMSNSGPSELSLLAQQHYALRRTATMVARGASPAKVFSMVAEELARCLNVDTAAMFRFETDGTVVLLGGYTKEQSQRLGLGRGSSSMATHRRHGAAGRRPGPDGQPRERRGSRRRTAPKSWLAFAYRGADHRREPRVGPSRGGIVAKDSRNRRMRMALGDLADLVATAIANAAASEELQASRERLSCVGDPARSVAAGGDTGRPRGRP